MTSWAGKKFSNGAATGGFISLASCTPDLLCFQHDRVSISVGDIINSQYTDQVSIAWLIGFLWRDQTLIRLVCISGLVVHSQRCEVRTCARNTGVGTDSLPRCHPGSGDADAVPSVFPQQGCPCCSPPLRPGGSSKLFACEFWVICYSQSLGVATDMNTMTKPNVLVVSGKLLLYNNHVEVILITNC